MQSFHCELCSKGYSRMNDYEAHLSSYDHSHRQRMKDMKQMVKDPTAGARARKAEAKADGLISIKFGGDAAAAPNAGSSGNAGNANAGGGFKKGGFKKSGFKSAFASAGGADEAEVGDGSKPDDTLVGKQSLLDDTLESDTDDEGYEVYDPRNPTD